MTVTVRDGQSLYDLAVQVYGSIEGITYLIKDNSFQLGAAISPGQTLSIRKEYLKDEAVYLRRSGTIIANRKYLQPNPSTPDEIFFGDTTILWGDTSRTFEN